MFILLTLTLRGFPSTPFQSPLSSLFSLPSPFPLPFLQGYQWAGTRRYGVPADAISVPTDSASEIVKFTISITRESRTNAKAKYSSSVVPPDPSVHFYHCFPPFRHKQVPALPPLRSRPPHCGWAPGGAHKFPPRVREESGRQTYFGEF